MTDVKTADPADAQAAELEAVKAELAAARAELAAPKPAAPKSKAAAPKSKAAAEEVRPTHTLVLDNGELVQTDAPCASAHYGKDKQLHAVVRVVEIPEEVQ